MMNVLTYINARRNVRGHGSVAVTRLLPDAVAGLNIERLELLPGAFLRGTPHVRGTKEYLTGVQAGAS